MLGESLSLNIVNNQRYIKTISNRAVNHQVCVSVSLNSYFARYELRGFL